MSDANSPNIDPTILLQLTAKIVSAHAGKATLSLAQLTDMIGEVSRALTAVGNANIEVEAKELIPAVPVKKSVTPNFIICLEDGKTLKMLKRHLRTRYGMTPDDYRKKWDLPRDYPMVAPNYAAQRSSLAKKIGLGKSPRTPGTAAASKKSTTRKGGTS